MAKTIIKELIIVLLLCLAIILLLGIVLYEYVPIARTIPNAVSYTTPENIKQELAESSEIDESQIIMTYEVDSNDLNNYKKIQDYKPGKANPFSSYETTGESTTAGSSQSSENSSTGPQTNTEDRNTTSGGQFFQNKGTK